MAKEKRQTCSRDIGELSSGKVGPEVGDSLGTSVGETPPMIKGGDDEVHCPRDVEKDWGEVSVLSVGIP